MNKRQVSKLNEFADHFTKIHETIDDHEHCFKHHAEQIENRSTKHDVYLFQTQFDKFCLKEDVVREVAELRKVSLWQSGKIEEFGLALAARSGLGGGGCRKSARHRPANKRDARMNRFLGGSSMVATASQASLASGDGGTSSFEALPRCSTDTLETALTLTTVPQSDLSDSDSDSYDGGTSSYRILRQQLEAVAMGMVGLGHMALKETRLGESRSAQLAQEKELLEELLNVRHWVSSRTMPPGWDPTMLVTLALRCAHPAEDATPRRTKRTLTTTTDPAKLKLTGLFSKSLQGDLSVSSSASTLQRAFFSNTDGGGRGSVPPATSRPATKGGASDRQANTVKFPPPLSSRGFTFGGAETLPPLQMK
jgi:hypothetical protein